MTQRRTLRSPARCLGLLSRLSQYVDYELTPRQRRAIDEHCRSCTRCQRVIAGLQRTVSLYRRAGSTPLPPKVRARARANIARLLSRRPRAFR